MIYKIIRTIFYKRYASMEYMQGVVNPLFQCPSHLHKYPDQPRIILVVSLDSQGDCREDPLQPRAPRQVPRPSVIGAAWEPMLSLVTLARKFLTQNRSS